MKKSVKSRDLMYPDRLVSNMITDYIEGSFNSSGFLYRAIVVEIDMDGGKLSGPNTKVPSNFPNPRNSIKARIIGKDRYKSTDNLGVFWPMFPHDVMPLIEGEHVYVLFENPEEETSGVWICRIPEPQDVDTANFVDGNEKYKDSNSAIGIDQTVADMDTAPDPIKRSPEFVVEKVPDFKPRKGDRVIEGSNNTIIILGRDRPTDVDSGEKEGAGTIQIITGRTADSTDLSIDPDQSTIYVTTKSDIDENFATDSVGSSVGPVAAIGVKSDEIRIVARKGMKIVVEGGELIIQADNIKVGSGDAASPLVLGDKLVDSVLNPLLTALAGDAIVAAALGLTANAQVPGIVATLESIKSKKHTTE